MQESLNELVGMDNSRDKPSYYGLCASYLRGFKLNGRHGRTDDRMPGDRRMINALRKVYASATDEERKVMCGTSALPARKKAHIFNQLVFKVARAGHLTATIILPEKGEKNDEYQGE